MISKFFNICVHPLKRERYRLYLYSLIVGFTSGGVVIGYRLILEKIEHFREWFFSPMKQNGVTAYQTLILILGALIISYIISYLMKKYPLICGGGVPIVKGVFSRQMQFSWFKDVVFKFISGLLALLAGVSLGIEGPSIQLGAETGEGVAKRLKKSSYERQYFIACGASAGISAAFHAPFTGVVFVIEELVKHISPLLVTCTLISAVVASWLSNDIFGLKPFFLLSTGEKFHLEMYYLIILFSFLIAALGKLFYLGILDFRAKILKMKMNHFFKVFIPIAISIILSIYFHEVTGGGHHLGEDMINKSFSIKYLLFLLVAKGLFTVYAAASGIPGGIFVPMISLGAIAGKIFGTGVVMLFGSEFDYTIYFIIIGMSSFLTAVLKTPMTATVLAMEITGSFNHFFPITVATMGTLVFSDILKMEPLYDILLEKLLHSKRKMKRSNEKTIVQIPVSCLSYLERKRIKDVKWPENTIVTEIVRGEQIIIPKGNTKICFGDILILFTDIETAQKYQLNLEKMGESVG